MIVQKKLLWINSQIFYVNLKNVFVLKRIIYENLNIFVFASKIVFSTTNKE